MGQHPAAITGRSSLALRPEPAPVGDSGQHARNNGHIAVFVVDVDQFKRVNDRYGHVAGDAVISEVARIIRQEVCGDDVLGRLGGDEFVVLVEGYDDPRARVFRIAERIRRAVGELCVSVTAVWGEASVSDLSVSIGAAVPAARTPNAADLTTLLWPADGALYAAKKAGRNTVRIEEIADGLIDTGNLSPRQSSDRPFGMGRS